MKIPIASLLAAIPMLVGGILWLANTNSLANSTAAQVKEMKEDNREIVKELKTMNKSLVLIRWKLNIKKDDE